MTSPLKVSIIISSYNYAAFVRDAIDSALQQTYPHMEIIVVDDGSTDNSRDILNEYAESVKLIFKKNGGQASAFNTGFENCQGDVIIFLDSDDLINDDAVEKIVPLFSDPEVSKVHWILNEIDNSGTPTGRTTPSSQLSEGNFWKK